MPWRVELTETVPVWKLEDQPVRRYSSPDATGQCCSNDPCCDDAAELSTDSTYSAQPQMIEARLHLAWDLQAHWQLNVEPHAQVSDNGHRLNGTLVDVDGTGLW